MAVEPEGNYYPHPWGGQAVRVTRISSLVDGGDVNGLVGWAVNIGAMGAVQTHEDWALLDTEALRFDLAKKRGHELRRASSTKGTKVHQIIAKVIAGTAQPWMLELAGAGYMTAFQNFLADTRPVYIDAERTVYGRDHQDSAHWWAGTVDLVATFGDDPRLTYVDWKTGSAHLAYTAQLGGYGSSGWWSLDGTELLTTAKPERLIVVYLHDSGAYHAQELDLDYARRLWMRAWDLHKTINEKEYAQ